MNLLMKGAALAPPFSCTTKYSSDVYSPRPPDIRVRLLPTKPPVHFTTEQPGRDTSSRSCFSSCVFQNIHFFSSFRWLYAIVYASNQSETQKFRLIGGARGQYTAIFTVSYEISTSLIKKKAAKHKLCIGRLQSM